MANNYIDSDSESTTTATDSSGEPLLVTDDMYIGLNNAQLSSHRRSLLELMNKLKSNGAQLDIDLPQIAVIGGQSAGKSSLIESISGVKLPRASGTCTRCATECRLSSSDDPWKCDVYLRFIVDAQNKALTNIREVQFGSTMYDQSEVEHRLRNAQRAILNPSIPVEDFVDNITTPETKSESELSFSRNYISIHISGPDLADLSFCDLPGLIATVGRTGHQGDIQLVESLLKSYIEKPSCLILLAVTCETDFETQGAFTLASKYDPDGKRTIGVLTKPDRIAVGDEDNWINFIRNEVEPLNHGWFCVKQPDSQQLKRGVTWEEARANEAQFFADWMDRHPSLEDMTCQLGTENLVSRLSDILSELIAKRLPEICNEVELLIKETGSKYEKLPKLLNGPPVFEMLDLIQNFKLGIDKMIEGDPSDPNGLMQQIQRKHQLFKHGVRHLAPYFRPYPEGFPPATPHFWFLRNEGDDGYDTFSKNKMSCYIGKIKRDASNARTRELPGFVPYSVTRTLIENVIEQWKDPARLLLEAVRDSVTTCCQTVISAHFSRFEHTGLMNTVKSIVREYIQEKYIGTERQIDWLYSLEEEPSTMNTQFQNYKADFLEAYRVAKAKAEKEQNELGTNVKKDSEDLEDPISDDEALDIMASVRAYYQVSFKRFVDNVALAIDKDLVRSLSQGMMEQLRARICSGSDVDVDIINRTSSSKARRSKVAGVGIGGSDSGASGIRKSGNGMRKQQKSVEERCRDLLKEQPAIAFRRSELERKLNRLNAAKRELMENF